MSSLLEIVMIVAVIALQTFAGYIGNKYMGAVLPIVFTGIVVYLFISGNLTLSFSDIFMPIIGPLVLIGIYESGKESKKKKVEKEMDKMRARDISKK